jgi:hypothetical protein
MMSNIQFNRFTFRATVVIFYCKSSTVKTLIYLKNNIKRPSPMTDPLNKGMQKKKKIPLPQAPAAPVLTEKTA